MDLAHSEPALAHSRPTVVGIRHPIHASLVPFPVVCFTLALLTDIAFWQTANIMWQNFSAWLLFAGLVFGAVAVLAGIVGWVFRSRALRRRPAWAHGFLSLVVLALAFLNSLVHAGDGWTAVVPYGLILSLATVLVAAFAAWLGRAALVHHRIGEPS